MAGAVLWAGCASAVTGPSSSVTATSASLSGVVGTSTGGPVSYWVEYGPTSSYGSETDPASVTLDAGQTRTVGVDLDGLARTTTYHYRFCASDSEQNGPPGCGADSTFTTQAYNCGETVTTDVKLTSSVDCQNAWEVGGWTIGADGVDINLNGYSFLGVPTRVGIRSDGFSDVTIRNGFIGGWATTAVLGGGSRNRILNVDGFRFSIGGGQDHVVRHSDGHFAVASTTNLLFTDNTLTAGFGSRSAPAFSGTGLIGARILHNEVQGVSFEPGIELSGSGMRIVENEVTGSSEGGIVLLEGADNVIRANQVLNATNASGDASPQFGDGIFVGPLATGTLLRDNIVSSNAGDGIEVRSASTRLLQNDARFNGDLGIEAVAGVTDLGGNRAASNGNPLQCTNISCSP